MTESIEEIWGKSNKESLINAIKNHNNVGFEKCLKEYFDEIYEEVIKKEHNDNIIQGGCHYVSPSLGEWFRFNFPKKLYLPEPSPFIENSIKYLYERVPREYNLWTYDKIDRNRGIIYIKLGGKCLEKNGDIFTIDEESIGCITGLLAKEKFFKLLTGDIDDNEGNAVFDLIDEKEKKKALIKMVEKFVEHIEGKGDYKKRKYIQRALFQLVLSHIYTLIDYGNKHPEIYYGNKYPQINYKNENPEEIIYTLFIPYFINGYDSTGNNKRIVNGGMGFVFNKDIVEEGRIKLKESVTTALRWPYDLEVYNLLEGGNV